VPRTISASAMRWTAPVRSGNIVGRWRGRELAGDGDASASAEGEHAENRAPRAHELRSSGWPPRALTTGVRSSDEERRSVDRGRDAR
jgi:hypothetical protein